MNLEPINAHTAFTGYGSMRSPGEGVRIEENRQVRTEPEHCSVLKSGRQEGSRRLKKEAKKYQP